MGEREKLATLPGIGNRWSSLWAVSLLAEVPRLTSHECNYFGSALCVNDIGMFVVLRRYENNVVFLHTVSNRLVMDIA